MKKLFIALALTFAIIASSLAQTFQIVGPTTVYEGRISVWYVINEPAGTDYVAIYGSTNGSDVTWPEDQYQFDEYRITPTGTGTIWISGQARWGREQTNRFYIEVIEDPAPVPPVPSIGGDNYVSVYDVEAYSMPTGKQDYEWIMPFSGTYHVQEYNNLKVIGFTVAGNRTLRGRYKEGGVWSEYGIKNIVVQ